MSRVPSVQDILSGDRSSLSRGITLVESTLLADMNDADRLLDGVHAKTGKALRVAVTGAPGVGKSTLIETLGMHLVQSDYHVAVLTVDPSSPQTGGSILGDKTRMPQLAKHTNAFIRPSPSGNVPGGIAHTTRRAMLLCEAAGYNVVLIETVGTGQGDTLVRQIVDIVLLMLLPNAGDELQGIKRGILEIADVIAVSKADGDMVNQARLTANAYSRALHLSPERSQVIKVKTVSALEKTGIPEIWEAIRDIERTTRENGSFETRRNTQIKTALLKTAKTFLVSEFSESKIIDAAVENIHQQVTAGTRTVTDAAHELVRIYRMMDSNTDPDVEGSS
ncbi:MAG: methylmalonyl Co-A mutase-associated GTPase MeaB [Rhodothermaceae bacterium]|nr:methylmalonyl Co-A mutase-associated GTPase MeaB [Rhodothermaceae bacterium]MYF41511.1 methylmalonyl Co-A mutase-associated GTPase MeaB [Rhodothermaceae bacterium]